MTVVIRFPERARHSTRYRLAEPGEVLELTTGPGRLGWTRYRVVAADLDEIEIEMIKEGEGDQPEGDDPGDSDSSLAP